MNKTDDFKLIARILSISNKSESSIIVVNDLTSASYN